MVENNRDELGPKNEKKMVVSLKLCISDPMLSKPKCVWKWYFFQLSKIVIHFIAVCLQFFKLKYRLSNIFWLYQHGVKYALIQSYSHFFTVYKFHDFCIIQILREINAVFANYEAVNFVHLVNFKLKTCKN